MAVLSRTKHVDNRVSAGSLDLPGLRLRRSTLRIPRQLQLTYETAPSIQTALSIDMDVSGSQNGSALLFPPRYLLQRQACHDLKLTMMTAAG